MTLFVVLKTREACRPIFRTLESDEDHHPWSDASNTYLILLCSARVTLQDRLLRVYYGNQEKAHTAVSDRRTSSSCSDEA